MARRRRFGRLACSIWPRSTFVLRGPKGHVALMLAMTGVDRVIQVLPLAEGRQPT
jgi:hypothetical protein